jgi:AcrR family transcriptional regulator
MVSLRERKKAQTRQRIADVATGMFIKHGFDNVTISEIAEAADVSKVTVFNYFQHKEDIFFDREPQAKQLLATAIRCRDVDESPLRAMRRLLLDLASQGHPVGGLRDRYRGFWQTVLDSPALRARAREAVDELENDLARLIADTSDDPDPKLTAALAVAAARAAYTTSVTRMLAGESAAEVTADHLAAINRGFDALERALP